MYYVRCGRVRDMCGVVDCALCVVTMCGGRVCTMCGVVECVLFVMWWNVHYVWCCEECTMCGVVECVL